ncbi:unnamed protein product [Spirodela intermedia]|uniref:Uncharacterized protein n=1 Tax=Spirodela intermedia TaxID=51605 RepID=A0A7I8LC24_SPIIN|nr:unnamed protein product [Spirodela intermedia]
MGCSGGGGREGWRRCVNPTPPLSLSL